MKKKVRTEPVQIVWADDQPDVIDALEPSLGSLLRQVRRVSDGEGALHAVNDSVPDLLILDLQMPPGDWGGLEVLSRLGTETLKAVPTIVLSGVGNLKQCIEARRLGAKDYVEKEAAAQELARRVEVVLDAAAADGERSAFERVRRMSIRELLQAGESMTVEFKSSARWNLKGKVRDAKLEYVISKTVAGFMNSDGGVLLIGVDDAGAIVGLEADYLTLQKPNRDGFELFLGDLFKTNLSGAAQMLTRKWLESFEGRDVCRVDVPASSRPVFARPVDGKERTEFWVRSGNSTRQLVGEDMVQYHKDHWE